MPGLFRRQFPNSLTVLRLFLAAGFFATLNTFRYPDINVMCGNISIALFILAAITDALDGHLARRWGVQSDFGRLMDPFCDKVLVLGAFIYLAGPRFVIPERVSEGSFFTMATSVYPWMVVVILARELLITGVRGVLESRGVEFGAQWSGKLKMILQSIAIPVILFLAVNFHPADHAWAMWGCGIFAYGTLAVTVWSGVPYVRQLGVLLKPAGGDEGSST